MDEPSMPNPSSNDASENCSMGNETWCHSPGRSVKRRSSSLAPFPCANSSTDFGSALADDIKRLLHRLTINPRQWQTKLIVFMREISRVYAGGRFFPKSRAKREIPIATKDLMQSNTKTTRRRADLPCGFIVMIGTPRFA